MDNLILDPDKKRVIQLSNDAFYYLNYGEEPLDEDNLEEAKEIAAEFPNGFYIEDDWKLVDDSDLIEATFIPYVKDEIKCDAYENLTNCVQSQIKWIDKENIRAWLFNSQIGSRKLFGDFKVYTDKYGNKCFHTGDQNESFVTGKMSLFYIKRFKKL